MTENNEKRGIQEFLQVMFMGVHAPNTIYVSQEFFNELAYSLKSMMRYTSPPAPENVGFEWPEILYMNHSIRSPNHPEAPRRKEIVDELLIYKE